MNAKRFVDTNILRYAKDSSEAAKQPIAEALIQELWETRSGCLSVQVLDEYYVNATQKLKPGLTQAEAWADVEALQPWGPIPVDFTLLTRGFQIETRYGLSWRDSLVVAAAVACNCKEILSEDLASGQVYDGVTAVNPFAS